MLAPISSAKYPALTADEERISIPLSTLALAIFDAVLVHVLNTVDDDAQPWHALRAEMCSALNDKKNDRTASILESDLYSSVDIVFIQESSKAFADLAKSRTLGEALFDLAEIAPEVGGGGRDQNSMILLKKKGWTEVVDLTKEVSAVIADRAAAASKKTPVAAGDVACFGARREADGEAYLLASFHGDTNGLATAPVLEAVDAYHKSAHPKSKLLFGLDANVHSSPKEGRANVADFAELFTKLGMSSCYGNDPDPEGFTTFNARTYLQPQLNKAVKAEDKLTSPLVDRNPKDFVLFYESDFALKAVSKDNTGRGAYDNDIVFPTLVFPSDHAITKASLAALHSPLVSS